VPFFSPAWQVVAATNVLGNCIATSAVAKWEEGLPDGRIIEEGL